MKRTLARGPSDSFARPSWQEGETVVGEDLKWKTSADIQRLALGLHVKIFTKQVDPTATRKHSDVCAKNDTPAHSGL